MSAINITWSETTHGDALTDDLDFGTIASGFPESDDLYITSDVSGSDILEDCAFYVRPYSGIYEGAASAQDDYNEILAWGLVGSDADDGGLSINQQTEAGATTWERFTPSNGTSTARIALSADTGVSTAEEMAAGEEAHIEIKVAVPSSETVVGVRQLDLCFYFTYDA